MLSIIRTTTDHPDFLQLVHELDQELAVRDGDEHAFYDQFNKLPAIKHVLVAYEGTTPVGCGALKEYAPDTMEVKRMYVPSAYRGRGIASELLKMLEQWAKELLYHKCILETGTNQPEALQLYHKNHYKVTPNYGQYEGMPNSVCFEKYL